MCSFNMSAINCECDKYTFVYFLIHILASFLFAPIVFGVLLAIKYRQ